MKEIMQIQNGLITGGNRGRWLMMEERNRALF
jgi:hypothetical protein